MTGVGEINRRSSRQAASHPARRSSDNTRICPARKLHSSIISENCDKNLFSETMEVKQNQECNPHNFPWCSCWKCDQEVDLKGIPTSITSEVPKEYYVDEPQEK